MRTDELTRPVGDLCAIAQADLDALWREVRSALEARDALLDIMPALLARYGSAAAALAADWYDEARLEVGAAGRFAAIPAPVDDLGGEQLVRWGVGPLFVPEVEFVVAARSASTLIEGGMRRRITNAARDTVTASAVADPAARGWQRAGRGDCGFCTMLIARGAVYTASTADFAAHDHCSCYAVPAWRGRPVPVKPYTPSARTATDAERAAVRDYLRANT